MKTQLTCPVCSARCDSEVCDCAYECLTDRKSWELSFIAACGLDVPARTADWPVLGDRVLPKDRRKGRTPSRAELVN